MKEVMIILRPKMYFKTKKALVEAGFHSMTVKEIIGRGKKPIQYDMDQENCIIKHRLVAKRLIEMYVRDEDVDFLIETVIKTNQTSRAGDGKIFVLPVKEAIRIRTNEKGNEAVI